MNVDPITNKALSETLRDFTGIKFLNTLIPNLIALVLIIASIAAFFYLILGGIRYILSNGEKAGMETARNQITTAIIGLALVFSIYAIIMLIGQFFGLNLLKFDLGPLIIK